LRMICSGLWRRRFNRVLLPIGAVGLSYQADQSHGVRPLCPGIC
jgi:hypothetical protein